MYVDAKGIRRARHLYGLSPEDVAHLESRGACWCCDKPPSKCGPLQIDHDHALGGERGGPDKERLRQSVRGLVCATCNSRAAHMEGGRHSSIRGPARATVRAYLDRPYPFAHGNHPRAAAVMEARAPRDARVTPPTKKELEHASATLVAAARVISSLGGGTQISREDALGVHMPSDAWRLLAYEMEKLRLRWFGPDGNIRTCKRCAAEAREDRTTCEACGEKERARAKANYARKRSRVSSSFRAA